jgi:putative addiction module component (TIGR02574 family)
MNKATLRKELMALAPAERIELAMALWDSIEPQNLPPLTDEHIAEAEREWVEHQKDPTSAVPLEEVRSWLRSRRR